MTGGRILAGRWSLIFFIILTLFSGGFLFSQTDGSRDGAAEPIWIFDSDLDVKHIETADLNNDEVPDVIAGEYSMTYYGDPSKVYALDGSSGDTLWSYQLNDGVRAMTIGDLNNDGVMDVIAGAAYNPSGTPDGYVHAIDGSDGSQLWTFYIGESINCLTVGNFNGDMYPDVAAGTLDDYIFAINGETGGQLWSRNIGSLWINGVDAADVDDDGIDDVGFAHEYLTNFDNYYGVLDGNDGSFIWGDTVVYIVMDVLIEDIDDDGHLEAIFGGIYREDQGEIFVRNAVDGTLEWSYNLGSLDHSNGNIILEACDLDEDLDLDLVVGTYLGTQQIFAFDGDSNTPMWISETLDGNTRDISFGDVTGEKDIDVVAATSDRVQTINGQDGTKIWYYAVSGTMQGVGCADFDGDEITDVAAGGGADHSGSNPGKTVWALRTIQSPVLWEYNLGEYANGVAVGNLNGDEFEDVVAVMSVGDNAVAINGETGEELWTWYGTENLYAVTMGDFDNDGKMEVAVGGYDQTVTAIDGDDGTQMWQFTNPTNQIYRQCLKSADLNNDMHDDVIAGCDNGQVYGINGLDGSQLWACPVGAAVNDVKLAQMNEKGPVDVVVAVGTGASGEKVSVIDGSNGNILWEAHTPEGVEHVEVFDANEDGILDVAAAVTPFAPQQIVMFDGLTHDSIWTKPMLIASNINSMAHGDLDYDKIPELLVPGSSSDKAVHALRGSDGYEHWSFPTGGELNCLMVYDVDNDLDMEVVAGSDDQNIYVLSGLNGQEEWSYSTAGDVMDLGIGDISGNGLPNLACVTFDSDGMTYAFKTLASGPSFVCGDANGDDIVNLLDITAIISYLYIGGPAPDPLDAADADGNGVINLLDITWMISYLYMGGPEPIC